MKTEAEYLAEDIADTTADLAGYVAAGDTRSARDARANLASLKADYDAEVGASTYEVAAAKYGAPALNNEGIHTDARLADL